MLHIMPTSDLKENFARIQDLVAEQGENVYLTQNGYGSMVIMNLEAYEKITQNNNENMPENTTIKTRNRTAKKINIPQTDIIDD